MAGSPHRLFRLTDAGDRVVRMIEAGTDLEPRLVETNLVQRLLEAGAIHPAPLTADSPVTSSAADVSIVTPQLGGEVIDDGRITVDDGSDPPLAGATVRLDRNSGPSSARNAGRREVSTPFVLFVDADVDVPELDPSHPGHRDWWRALLRHFEDRRVGLVAPRVTGDDGSSLDLGAEPARIRAGTRVSYAPGAAVLIRAAAFDDVGGFDETLRLGEDVDLVWRLGQAGWRCRYEPGATVHHRPRATFGEQLRQQVKYGSSSGPLARRHPKALAPFRAGGWTVAVWALAAAGRPAASVVVGVASAVQLVRGAPDLSAPAAARLATVGHLAAGRQLTVAVRRAWWPILVPLLWSRRVRRIAAVSFAVAPTRAAKDVAFSIGLWRSVVDTGELGPLRPELTRRGR